MMIAVMSVIIAVDRRACNSAFLECWVDITPIGGYTALQVGDGAAA